MCRQPIRSAEEELSAVMSVLRGEMTQVEVALRFELSQTTISEWLQHLTDEVEAFRQTYNQIRPHETLAFQTPHSTYLHPPA